VEASVATAPPLPHLSDSERRILVIYNPVAGWRHRALYVDTLRAMANAGCRISVHETRWRGDGESVVASVTHRDFDVVAVAGGDGTINEVVNGLGAESPALAVIPLGTANVLAAELRIPPRSGRVAETVAHGRRRLVHCGRANGRRFLMMAGVGFDAHVVAGVTPTLKRRWGKGAYVWRSLVELVRYRIPTYDVTIDGVAHEAASAIIAKGRHYGGPYVLAPEASLAEPIFDICLFETGGRANAVRAAIALPLGRLPRLSSVRMLRGHRIDIAASRDEPVQADGDLLTTLPLHASIDPVPIALIAPG